jgi:hypothetical protein
MDMRILLASVDHAVAWTYEQTDHGTDRVAAARPRWGTGSVECGYSLLVHEEPKKLASAAFGELSVPVQLEMEKAFSRYGKGENA